MFSCTSPLFPGSAGACTHVPCHHPRGLQSCPMAATALSGRERCPGERLSAAGGAPCHSGLPLPQSTESPDSTVQTEPNTIYKTNNRRSKYLAHKMGAFVLCGQTLPGGRGSAPAYSQGWAEQTSEGLAGVTRAVSSRQAPRSFTPITPPHCHRETCVPFACPQGLGGLGAHGKDVLAEMEQKHLPRAHPTCIRRQRLLRDAPLTCHQCSFFP